MLTMNFKCSKCKRCYGTIDQKEKLHDDVETLTDFLYLEDKINTGGCEVAVAYRTRLGWIKLIECQDVLCRKNFH